MDLNFNVESSIGLNGKVPDEGEIEVVVGDTVRYIKRTIGDLRSIMD